ncbi:MAG TPA: O-antigen ligase family protein [Candidatus Acidoferrales bacterium]
MKLIGAGLCGLIALMVLAFGGVEVWSQSILEAGAGLLFVTWAIIAFRDPNLKITWNPLCWPLLGLLAIGVGQMVFRLTAYPFLTRVEILKLISYFLIFFLTTQVFRERQELNALAWALMFLCFGVALLGIVQRFTSEGSIYWFQKLTAGGDPFGPFVNRNHFAGFAELTIPVGLSLLIFRGLRRDTFPLAGLLAIVPIGALILSGSRGGIISFAFELAVLGLMARARKRGAEPPRLAALAVVGLAALGLIGWLGASRAIERFSTLHAGDVSLARRGTMVRGAAHIFFKYPVAGCGLGALVAVYPRYETLYDGLVVDHVHNDYMELLAEMGLLGALCGGVFLWILFRDAKKSWATEQGHFSRAIHAAGICAVCGLLLHSLVDFNLHIPSNALLFLVAAHLATTAPLPSEGGKTRRRTRKRRHGERGEEEFGEEIEETRAEGKAGED